MPVLSAPGVRTFEGTHWKFVLTETKTGVVVSALDGLATARTVSRLLGEAWPATGTVPGDDPRIATSYIPDSEPFLAEGVRSLVGFRDTGVSPRWEPAYTGLILQIEDTIDGGVPVSHYSAWDVRKYLDYLPVVKPDGSLPGQDGYVFSGVNGNEIARTLLDNIVDNGISTLLAVLLDPGAPSGWGTAFWAGDDETTAALDITFQQGMMAGEAFRALEETGSIDIALDPVYDPANRPGCLSDLSFYAQRGSEREEAIFSWDMPPRSLVALGRLEDGSKRANTIQFYAGQGGPPASPQTDATSVAKFGEYWAQQAWPGKIGAEVEYLAAEQLLLRKNRQVTVTASPAPARSYQAIQDYDRGDRVPLYARSLRKPLAGYTRIYGVPFSIGDDALETVESLLLSAEGLA